LLLGLLVIGLLVWRRRRHAADGSWGMIDGPASGGAGALSDAEIQSWRPDRGNKKASFMRINSTRIRIGNALRNSVASVRTPTTPMGAVAFGRPVSAAQAVPPVPALPVAHRPSLAPVEEDAQELAKDWAPPASRVRRKAVPEPAAAPVLADPFADPVAATPFADPVVAALDAPPRLVLDFDPSRLSTVSDDAVVPPGAQAGVAM
jgi:hypothetical protein